MMGRLGPWLLLVLVASVSGKYVWNNTTMYWEWQGSGQVPQQATYAGSGNEGYDDEDYDYDDEGYEDYEGSGGPRRVEEPARPTRPNLIIPAEDEEEPNVDDNNYDQSTPPKEDDFFVMNDKEDRTESPDQVPTNRNLPWVVAAVIGGAVLGLLFIIFMVFRMRKKDKEGSKDEPKKAHNANTLNEPKRIGV